jgi:hypothetical protein
MSTDYITIFTFLFFLLILSVFFFKSYPEGMTNKNNVKADNTGHGINSGTLTEQLKIEHNNMKDKLNIKQYRNNYENVIIDMSDYLDGLMLHELLSLNPLTLDSNKIMNSIDNINKISSGKQNLNKIMKFVDEN